MIHNSGIFAFDIDFENDGKTSLLEVFIMYNEDESHYYYCMIDGRQEYAFAKRDDGAWVDMKEGKTDLARRVGEIIESQLRIDHKFHTGEESNP